MIAQIQTNRIFQLFTAVVLCAVFAPVVAFTTADSKGETDEHGMHIEDWFDITENNLAADMAAAKANGKRLVLVFEQKNCEYCRKLHKQLLVDSDIKSYLQDNFMMVQYNLHGKASVTDLDGEVLTESGAAAKWKISASPSYLFLPVDASEKKSAKELASAITSGTPKKPVFINLFKWVDSNVYHDNGESFKDFNKRMMKSGG